MVLLLDKAELQEITDDVFDSVDSVVIDGDHLVHQLRTEESSALAHFVSAHARHELRDPSGDRDKITDE